VLCHFFVPRLPLLSDKQDIYIKMPTVHLLDYVAGNIRSLVNAIEKVGYTVEWIKSPEDVPNADVREPLTHPHQKHNSYLQKDKLIDTNRLPRNSFYPV
jgi:hypothetical protein